MQIKVSEQVPQVNRNIPHLNRHEREWMDLLMFSARIFEIDLKYMAERLKMIKNGNKRAKSMVTQMLNLFRDLTKAVDLRTLNHMEQLRLCGELTIKPVPVVQAPGYFLLSEECGKALIRSCIESHCALCMKDADEAEHCDLYNAMITILPPDEINTYGCPYRFVQLYEHGEKIGGVGSEGCVSCNR